MNEIIVNEETLVSQVNKNTTDITKLKSNVKWIYQYGGVGGSGGGPNNPSTTWSIYATLDNQIIKNDGQLILKNEDENGNKVQHNLVISIAKPNGLTYTIKSISYYNGSELKTQKINKKLTSGNYEYVYNNININGNGVGSNSLTISIDCDDDPDPKDLKCSTICNPFNASATFQEFKNGVYKNISNKDSIYVSTITNLYLTIDYTLYVSSDSIVKLIFDNNNLNFNNYPENGQQIITERSGILRYEINNNVFNDSNYYGINNISLYFEIDDGSDYKQKIDLSTSCTLIPDGLFLRISPYYKNNNLYNNINYISSNKSFNTGLLYLNLTGYYGTPNARTFNVSCLKTKIGSVSESGFDIYDDYSLPVKSDFLISEESKLFDTSKNILNLNNISEITLTRSYLNISEPGIYALSFLISVEENGEIKLSDIYTYYIYVVEAQNAAHWIEDIEFEQLSSIIDASGNIHNTLNSFSGAISSDYSYHYKFGNDITDNIFNFVNKYGSYITVNSNNAEDINLINISPDGNALPQYIINIGIQYSNVNDINDPIFTLYGNDPAYNIVFYQNKIFLYNEPLEIYLPLSDNYNPNDPSKYHLISLVRQKMNDNEACYSYIFYINGIPEVALSGSWVKGIAYTGIKLHKANYSLNLIDVKNIAYEINDEYNDKTYKLELRDHIISEYYMQYATNIFGNNLDEQLVKSINSLNISKNFIFENNIIKVKDGLTTLKELKKILTDTPIMVFDFSEELEYNTKDSFFNSFFFIDASQNKKRIQFSSLYYNNFEESDIIKIPNGYWSIEPQGSSTLTYKIKNLELSSNTYDTDEGNASMYIFSPNFKNINNSMSEDERNNTYITSFLPEVSYTLKADEMDSSHCNNTSVGLFVNKNTTKFADVINLPNVSVSKYKNYIKNCLTGYPCMLFIQLIDNETNSKEVYYLGIYNFNLGRASEFNLGYKDTNILDNIRAYNRETNLPFDELGLRDGFNIYNIQVSAINQKNSNLCVAEIQGNDSRFDFSQFDKTILFDQTQGEQKDNYYMLGDIVPEYNDNPDMEGKQKGLLTNFIQSITYAGGFIFDTIGKGMSNSLDDEYGYKEGFGYKTPIDGHPQLSKNMVPNYHYQATRTLNGNINTYEYTQIRDANSEDLFNAICETRDGFGNLRKYPTLDYISIVEYYVICMAFGMVDSVQKNLNIKSWTADNDFGARFYAAFYDMDTSNGKTNGGGKTNKYAFSDYWVTLHDTNSEQLEQSNIFRDFFPVSSEGDKINNKPGYDTPSSYLFAIAKYASLFGINNLINGISQATSNICPENLWAHFRRSNGELRNAKYFIDNYFYVNMDKIPIQFIALNYRFKYLQLAQNSFDSSTLEKFNGLGKYYAEDWLNDRFHILDAYFNLQQENKQVLKYNYELLENANIDNSEFTFESVTERVIYNTQQLSYSSNTNTNVPDLSYLVDTGNPDIYVINHIFNTNSGAQIKGLMKPFSISAFDMSPLIIKGTNNTVAGSYIIPDSSKVYTIDIHKESNENWMFGGSQAWTRIENILPFINEQGGFYVHSDKLRIINGNQGVCNNWQIECQSLQDLSLIGPNYGGILNIDCRASNENAKYWQNIKNINISGSKIGLTINNAVVNKITCDSINVGNNGISIIDCLLLETLSFNNLIANSLTITPFNTNNFTVTNCDIKEVKLSPKYTDSTLTIDTIQNLEKITISASETGSIKKLVINNCVNIKKLEINSSIASQIENLQIKRYAFEKLTNTESDSIYVKDNILHLEKFTNLKSISFEECNNIDTEAIGFNTIILPNNDEIELQAYAFYETNLCYIDFADKQNDNHTLVLCDNEQQECRIFENSAFTMQSSYSIPNEYLKFKVKDNKLTSLSRLFYISSRRTYLGAHNGMPNITYSAARSFINNLGKTEQAKFVSSFEYAFHRQSNIEAKFILNAEDDSYNYSVDSLITLAGYSNLSNIGQMFEHTQINFVDENFFGPAENACGSDLTDNININILNFMPYNVLAYMHFNALDNIKNKITQFLFTGKDDTQAQREDNNNAIWIYGLVDNSYINVHDLLFNNEESNLVELCGFNISRVQKIDLNNLFTSNENNIKSIHSVFNNLNQSKENSNLCDITNFNLQALTKLTTLSKSFVAIDTTLENVDIDKTIDILNYLDWNNQYQNLSSVNSSSTNDIFNFYKNIDFTQEENITKWNSCWSIIHQQETANHLFSNCLFIVNDNTETIQSIPYSSNSKVIRANGLFYNSTAYIKSTSEEIGIILTDNLISNLNKLHYAQNMFAKCKLNGINNYPINENLLSNLSLLDSIISMFEYTKIIGTHKTYNLGINKNIFYLNNLGGSICNNYILSDSNNTNGSGYPFIPENLFIHNINLTNISNIFADSDFEGYLPNNLLINQTKLNKINNFIYNCKILPQLYKQFNSEDNVNIYNYDNNDDINTTAYVFIPDNFIHSNEINIQNIINFNLLLSNNKHNRLYLMTNTSLNGKSPENINLTINSSSVLIGKYVYRSSDNSWYYPGSQGNNYMYSENIGFINLCINDEGNNIYSEGISIDTFNLTRSNNSCLVNSELASRYYGYIFKPQTLITKANIDSYVSKEMYFMTFGDFAVNPTNSMDKQPIPLSKDIILPPIIIHSTINADMIPPVNSYVRILLNDMYNKYKRNCLFRANTSGKSININNIDKSFIDDIKNNNKYTITTTEITENDNTYQQFDFILQYPSIQYSFTNNSKDNPELTLETFRNTCLNNILQQIVYNNYYLLFNDWNYSIPDSFGDSSLSTYYTFVLDNNNTSTNGYVLLTSDDKYSKPEALYTLYPLYKLKVSKDETNVYIITSITKQ